MDKDISSQFAKKLSGKMPIYVLNNTLKTGIFTGLSSIKSGRPDNWRF